ncbi:MAG: DUF1800 domain-containing protein [Candidatus Eisenbacteria bacterium]|nr:DUF1800 domain-containing protein [Candidatus Eisenbacteria bacterium]
MKLQLPLSEITRVPLRGTAVGTVLAGLFALSASLTTVRADSAVDSSPFQGGVVIQDVDDARLVPAATRIPTTEERVAYEAALKERFRFLEMAAARNAELGRSCLINGERVEIQPLDPAMGSSLAPWDGVRRIDGDGNPAPIHSDWSVYAGPWGLNQTAHLLNRTMIGAKLSEMNGAVASGMNGTVTTLLATRPQPALPFPWALDPYPDTSGWTQQQFDSLNILYSTRRDLLKLWWTKQMIEDPVSMREAMTLFWHDHFATASDKVFIPGSLYKQNALLRASALGNVKTLVRDIGIDPAMLIWLDGIYSTVGNVNENYGRELLELFTMGVGNYTQDDVVAAARAYTGYTTFDGVSTVFMAGWHDNGSKTFLGQTGNFFPGDIVNIIFEQPATARFIVRKLYRYFLDEYPDEALIEDLAQTLRDSNWEIKPVLERMLKSARFYDTAYKGAVYKDGIDVVVGGIRTFGHIGIDLSDPTNPESVYFNYATMVVGEILMNPPNVGGWPGYRSWINSYTLPWRRYFSAVSIFPGQYGWSLGMSFQPINYAQQCSNPDDAGTLVDEVALSVFGMAPTPLVRQALLDALLGGMSYGEWNLSLPTASNQIRELLRATFKMADYQLK